MLLHDNLRKPSYSEEIIWAATLYYEKRKRNDKLNSMLLRHLLRSHIEQKVICD